MVSFGRPLIPSVLEVLELSTEMHSSHSLVQQLEHRLGGVIKLSGDVEDFFTPPYNATDIFQDLVGSILYSVFSLHPKRTPENLVDLQRLYFGIQIPNNFYSMYLVHVYQYSACRTLDLAHSEFLEKLVLLSQGSTVVLELFQSLVLQQKHLLRILQILQHTPNSVAKKKREFSTAMQAKEVCLQLMVLLNCSHLLSNQKLTSELVAFLKMHLYQTTLVLVHSENYLVLQNLYRSIQTKDRYCSPLLEKVKKHLSQIHQKKEQKLFYLVLAPEILTFSEEIFGTISISGESANAFVPNHIGSGSFRKLSGAAESFTANPEERQMLFSFIGEGQEAFVANPPEEGTEIRLSGSTAPEILAFAEESSGTIVLSGTAGTLCTILYRIGTFRKLSGAAESFTANPDERQMLFSFTGEGADTHRELVALRRQSRSVGCSF